MFKIGDFARINKVSIKTLHHYDELGILQPEKIDINTGYRYYSADQMIKLNQILAFKEASFSLHEIVDTFLNMPAKDQLIKLLEHKAEILEEVARFEQERLARLRTKIFLIKNGGIPIMKLRLKKLNRSLLLRYAQQFPISIK
jgi:DNA-binding transcriptional MerR regulator